MTSDTPGRGGRRAGAGRKMKSDQKRVQKSVNLTPRVWAFIATFPGSESDAIEAICRSLQKLAALDQDS
jgi:hypothetical protein